MTPKEKSKELLDKFLNEMPKYMQGKLGRETAKESALICVDEMIENLLSLNQIKEINRKGYYPTSFSTKEYWREVKQEIEEL